MDKRTGRVKTRHIILAVMCLMYFISYIDRVNIAVAGPFIRQEMGLTTVQLGLVFSAFAYPYAAMQIFGGLGYSRHEPFEHIYRHHRRYRITEGAEEIQIRRVAQRLFKFGNK